MYGSEKITLFRIEKPSMKDINAGLKWFGLSIGLFNTRDKDKTCFRVFIEFLKSAKKKAPLSSDDIAHTLRISRATVIHHINKLREAGIVVQRKNKYMLRMGSLEKLVIKLEQDASELIKEVSLGACELDRMLGL